jgi:hypothetical protein
MFGYPLPSCGAGSWWSPGALDGGPLLGAGGKRMSPRNGSGDPTRGDCAERILFSRWFGGFREMDVARPVLRASAHSAISCSMCCCQTVTSLALIVPSKGITGIPASPAIP